MVAWHGRVAIWKKGLDVLLEAWQLLSGRRDGELRLLLVGSGRDADELRARLEASGQENVIWVDELLNRANRFAFLIGSGKTMAHFHGATFTADDRRLAMALGAERGWPRFGGGTPCTLSKKGR